MAEEKRSKQPAPREAFGHPVTEETRHESSDHRPGFKEGPRPTRTASRAKKGKDTGATLPPRKAGKLPKTSLAERVRQRLAQQERET